MALRRGWPIGIAAGILLGVGSGQVRAAVTLQPIPPAECQNFAGQVQAAAGFAMTATEDDFTDLSDGSDGRSCHIAGNASDQTYAGPGELMTKVARVFADWRDDPNRAEHGPGGAEKGFVSGDRVATVQVSWEPGPGVSCSEKAPLSACNILPQQKAWMVIVDIVTRSGR